MTRVAERSQQRCSARPDENWLYIVRATARRQERISRGAYTKYVTRVAERSQQRCSAKPDELWLYVVRATARRQERISRGAYTKYVTRVAERSQQRCSAKYDEPFYSWLLTCCQSASISLSVALSVVLPLSARLFSIWRKRPSNLLHAFCNAISGL